MTSSRKTHAPALSRAEARGLLNRVVKRCAEPGAIAVFDLDSTLLNNAPRQALIMREYGADAGVEALTTVEASHWNGWDFEIPMRAVGLDSDLVAVHAAAFKDYWRERFFTSDYCVHDQPIAGASAFVRAVADAGARVFYVTGRHEPMRRGSIESFHRAQFAIPDGDRVRLIMKPSLEEEDDDYKDRTYQELRAAGPVVTAFDNEPTHINGYHREFPESLSIHLATDHSLRDIPVDPGIPSILDFAAYQP